MKHKLTEARKNYLKKKRKQVNKALKNWDKEYQNKINSIFADN